MWEENDRSKKMYPLKFMKNLVICWPRKFIGLFMVIPVEFKRSQHLRLAFSCSFSSTYSYRRFFKNTTLCLYLGTYWKRNCTRLIQRLAIKLTKGTHVRKLSKNTTFIILTASLVSFCLVTVKVRSKKTQYPSSRSFTDSLIDRPNL